MAKPEITMEGWTASEIPSQFQWAMPWVPTGVDRHYETIPARKGNALMGGREIPSSLAEVLPIKEI